MMHQNDVNHRATHETTGPASDNAEEMVTSADSDNNDDVDISALLARLILNTSAMFWIERK